ncbi:uncharacterized protein [Triticum aestivum]|uniref:uncharacterized protein n=1 Tax=Triticum aestivum TaxID=4565 RepID=UPI001D008F4A|nr:uncharacterized protein LOC123076035 [Triticum aestivum]
MWRRELEWPVARLVIKRKIGHDVATVGRRKKIESVGGCAALIWWRGGGGSSNHAAVIQRRRKRPIRPIWRWATANPATGAVERSDLVAERYSVVRWAAKASSCPPIPFSPSHQKVYGGCAVLPSSADCCFVGSQIRLRGRWKGDRRRGASTRRPLCEHDDISVSLSHGFSSRGKHIARRSSHAGPGTSSINPLKRKRGVYGKKKKKMIPVTPQEDLLFASSASESDGDEDTDMSSGSDM